MYADRYDFDADGTCRGPSDSECSRPQKLTPSALTSAVRQKGPTVVASGVTLTGGLSAAGVVEIHGKIIGDVCCAELEIGSKGRIEGSVIADEIIVSGEVRGSIYASQIELRNTARVDGDLHYQSLTRRPGAYCTEEPNCQCAQAEVVTEYADDGVALTLPQVSPRPAARLHSWARKMLRKLRKSRSEERARILASRFDGS